MPVAMYVCIQVPASPCMERWLEPQRAGGERQQRNQLMQCRRMSVGMQVSVMVVG